MDLAHQYVKIRKDFGRQPKFSMVAPHFLDTIASDLKEQKNYCLRNPVHEETQACPSMSEHCVNSAKIELTVKGINHAEGGWPKEINFDDEEATDRYRRRMVREEDYVNAVLTLSPKIDHYINQNNAIDLYDHYFKRFPTFEPLQKSGVTFNGIYKDPFRQQINRSIACMDWTFEDDSKVVVAYSNKTYPPVNIDLTCCVWDLEYTDQAASEFIPPTACGQVACSPVTPNVILGGLEDGRVCIFDIRKSKSPISITDTYVSHRDPVTALLFLRSRLNYEFFSGSSDGKCLWFDIRNVSKPTEALIMSISTPPGKQPSLANAEPVSALQYDRAFPTRFLCGTDTGLVINVNRKAKNPNEIMSAVYKAHNGTVRTVQRSPCTSKVFITCGDFKVHIWSDNILCSPIITGSSQRYQVQDVVWAPNKVSGYMSVGDDGRFRYWDILRKFREPIINFPLAKCPLLKIKPHEEGRLVAVGDKEGSLHLISLSESLVLSGDKDKQVMIQAFERESRREHILETRVKELRLKLKADKETVAEVDLVDYEALDKAAEEEYVRVVLEEVRKTGFTLPPSKAERKR